MKMGTMYLGGRKVSDDEATQLTQEAYFIRHSKLWAVMQSTLRKDAETRMFNKALSFDDMWAGKMMMYNLSVQNKILLVPKQNNSSETSVTV